MDILSDRKMPVFSLDIETTSLDHKTSKIWSVGISSNTYNQEFFQKDVVPEGKKGTEIIDFLVKAHEDGGAGDFARKQIKNKSFDEFQKRYTSNTLSSMNDTFAILGKNLKDKTGVFLVQNMNFESSAFGAAGLKEGAQNLSEDSRVKFLQDIFGVDPEKYRDSKQLIPQDKRILDARRSFQEATNMFKRSSEFSQETITNFRGGMKAASDNLERTLNSVVKENNKRGYMTAIDLMDVSKIYTSKLALNDVLKPGYVGTGLSVDYLSSDILKELEMHTALLDAQQQRRIYRTLTSRIDSINKTGKLSDKDIKFAQDLMGSDIHEKAFASSIQNRLTEAVQKRGALSETSVRTLVSQSLDSYSTIPEKETFSRKAFAEDIINSYMKDPSEAFAKISEMREGALLPDLKALAVPDESPLIRRGGATSNKAKILMGLSALGAVSMMATNNRPSKKEELTSYDDLYENVYLGQQYANWQERNNSHKMIY